MTWTITFKCGHKKQIQSVELPTKWQKKADKVPCPDCRKHKEPTMPLDQTSISKDLLGAFDKLKQMDKLFGRATLLRAVSLLLLEKNQSGDVIADTTEIMDSVGDAVADVYHCVEDYI